jgi:hypothetical protein
MVSIKMTRRSLMILEDNIEWSRDDIIRQDHDEVILKEQSQLNLRFNNSTSTWIYIHVKKHSCTIVCK